MNRQLTLESQRIEEILVDTVRKLPAYRKVQVLDFARWLQTQPTADDLTDQTINEVELAAEEAEWEAVYLANREQFRAMAQQAAAALDAGETMEMVIEEGTIRPQ